MCFTRCVLSAGQLLLPDCLCLLVKSDDVFVVVICWSVCGVSVFKVSFEFLVGAFSCINMNFVGGF